MTGSDGIQVLDHDYVLGHCSKYLARDNTDFRHNLNNCYQADDPRGNICEAWRFPIIDSYLGLEGDNQRYTFNRVTFVYELPDGASSSTSVGLVASCANLFEAIPLKAVTFHNEPTKYFAVTLIVPKREVHRYKFIVDGNPLIDPINPQRIILDNGQTWSRFFTDMCTDLLSFEEWEMQLLSRICTHILPFRTNEGTRFLVEHYDQIDQRRERSEYPHGYRLDESVGEVNFIDKLLAREELHHLVDYKICLTQMYNVLRQRNPYIDPWEAPTELFADLYNDMATNQEALEHSGWDYNKYNDPGFFLELLRRHTYTGAFSHPRYGGNASTAGWAYLAQYQIDARDANDPNKAEPTALNPTTAFAWEAAIEQPFGDSQDYFG